MNPPFVIPVNENNFEKEVVESDKLVLLVFTSKTCGPCKAMEPVLEKYAEDNQSLVKVVKIDIEESPNLTAALEIRAVPTMITVKDGSPRLGLVGAVPTGDIDNLVGMTIYEEMASNIKPPPMPPRRPPAPGA